MAKRNRNQPTKNAPKADHVLTVTLGEQLKAHGEHLPGMALSSSARQAPARRAHKPSKKHRAPAAASRFERLAGAGSRAGFRLGRLARTVADAAEHALSLGRAAIDLFRHPHAGDEHRSQ